MDGIIRDPYNGISSSSLCTYTGEVGMMLAIQHTGTFFSQMLRVFLFAFGLLCLSGCSYVSKWVYKIDIPQGNYIDQNQVNKLRIGMTKEQVTYILGSPLSNSAFNNDKWNYVYRFKTGKGSLMEKALVAFFEEERLIRVEGHFPVSENFHTPIEQDLPDLELASTAQAATPTAPEESSLWSVKLGLFTSVAKVNALKEQLEQAGYQVHLFPATPVEGKETQVFAGAGTFEAELEQVAEEVGKLTNSDVEVMRLPGS